jgi:cysteine-rich repeat protein
VPTLFLRYPSCRLVLITFFALGFAFATANASRAETVDFNGLRAYPVGANPKGLSIGDCNGDGAPDLVTAAQNSNEVVILQNVGDGTFEFGGGRTNVSQPVGATCADFNGDGLIDIAAASRNNDDITFYFQDAMGAFNPGGTRPAGAEPASLIGADVNGDTLQDLVAVDSTRATLTIYFGTGTATLPPFIPVDSGIASPQAAAVADFDLDGFADIAVAGATAPYVVVLYGSGVGFAQRGTIPNPFTQTRRPTRGRGIAAADLNNDNYPDLALLSSDGVVTLFRGSANGQFAYLDAFSVSTDTESIALSDLNGDGLVDLALLASDTNSAQVFLALDYGKFDLPGLVSVTAVSNGFGPVVSRTVLSDPTDPLTSVTQLMAADTNARAVSLVEQSDPTALSTNPLVSVQDAPTALALGDVSGDGIADVAVVGKALKKGKIPRSGPLQLRILLGNSSGQYFEVPSSGGGTCGNGVLETGEQCDDGNLKGGDGCSKKLCTIELGKVVPSLEIIDLDGDGRGDVVLTDARGQVLALISDGQGRFWQIRKLGDAKKATPAALGDFDGNGTTDVAFVSKSARNGALTLLNNVGGGFFVTTPIPLPATVKVTGSILAADFDRNGLPDVAAGIKGGWAVLFNDGSGPNRVAAVSLPKSYKKLSRLVAADFNEDGWLDLVTNYGAKVPTLFFRGSATGAFVGGDAIGAAGALSDPFAVDLDQDDNQDVVSCSAANGLSCRVLYGNGAGQFGAAALPSSTAVGREPRAAAAGDLDQDGFADVVGISRVDDVAVVLFGGTPAQNSRLVLATGSRPSDVEILDLNNDGHLDFIVANEATRDLSIFLNQTNRQFLPLARINLPAIPNSSLGLIALASGDIDNNGTVDLAVVQAGGQAGGTVTPLINVNGAGLAVSGSVPVGNLAWGIALGKLNGDDVLDIVTANRNDNTFSVLLSQANGTYTRSDVNSGGIRATDVAVADLDNDGFGDVIVTNEMIDAQTSNYGNVVTFLNDGNGGFPDGGSKHVRGREIPRAICAGDFDNDGQSDVAVASLGSNDIMVLFGAGNGTWRADERLFPVGDGALSVSCREADGDNRTDIAFGRRSGSEVGVILTNQ